MFNNFFSMLSRITIMIAANRIQGTVADLEGGFMGFKPPLGRKIYLF